MVDNDEFGIHRCAQKLMNFSQFFETAERVEIYCLPIDKSSGSEGMH